MKNVNYSKIHNYTFYFHPKAVAPRKSQSFNSLDECYGHYSQAKQKAFNYCKHMCDDLSGFNFSISGYNCMAFSVMFDFKHPETGELMRVHITPSYNHLYFL